MVGSPPLSPMQRRLASATAARHGPDDRPQPKGSKAVVPALLYAETAQAGQGRHSRPGPRAVGLPVGGEAVGVPDPDSHTMISGSVVSFKIIDIEARAGCLSVHPPEPRRALSRGRQLKPLEVSQGGGREKLKPPAWYTVPPLCCCAPRTWTTWPSPRRSAARPSAKGASASELRASWAYTTNASRVGPAPSKRENLWCGGKRRLRPGRTHGSGRSMEKATGRSKSSVHCRRRTFNLQPHRPEHVQLSTDPFFAKKVRDIVGR